MRAKTLASELLFSPQQTTTSTHPFPHTPISSEIKLKQAKLTKKTQTWCLTLTVITSAASLRLVPFKSAATNGTTFFCRKLQHHNHISSTITSSKSRNTSSWDTTISHTKNIRCDTIITAAKTRNASAVIPLSLYQCITSAKSRNTPAVKPPSHQQRTETHYCD